MSDPHHDLLSSLHAALSDSNESRLEDILETCDLEVLKACVLDDPTLFIQICARGFVTAARFLFNHCIISMTAEMEGRTALQWACLHGHAAIVELLLPLVKQANLHTTAWQETSEFYSATLGGHIEVVQLLVQAFPGVFHLLDIMQTLLYAACVGGHINMVRRWMLPSVNVNHPIEQVSSFLDCEHRTPFHAACQGSNLEMALLFVDVLGAEITEYAAYNFPKFTAGLVVAANKPWKIEEDEVSYDISHNKVHAIHPVWIQPYLSDLTHLILHHNKLTSLDPFFPWSLTKLVHLDISHNKITKLQAPGNAECIVCDRLEVVNASHNQLSEVCVDLFQLQSLTHLDLSHNALQRLKQPSQSECLTSATSMKNQWKCSSLTHLDLSHNQMDLMPVDDFKICTSLIRLNLSYNKLSCLPSAWSCPLEYLNVSHNALERFPPSTEQFWSGSLVYLFINNNQLDRLDENILKLGMLQKLNASHNCIQYLAPPHVWDCPSLVDLDLSHNCLGKSQRADKKKVGDSLGVQFPSKLLSEELRAVNLSHNDLIRVPVSVCVIKNLATLDISHNPLRYLPKELGNLQECWDLKTEGLKVQNSALQELIRCGKTVDVIEHLRNELRNMQPCYIMKVMVIGPVGKGKSTVVEALDRARASNVKFSDQPVTVTTTQLKMRCNAIKDRADNDRPTVTLRIWELAGSPELLAFHPVLWSENSLFLLVWDINDGSADLCNWLCNISSRLARVGVIIVVTFTHRITRTELDTRLQQFHADINALYGDAEEHIGFYPKDDSSKIYPHLCSVVLMTCHMQSQEVKILKTAVYESALRMVKVVHPLKFVVGQLLPQSYLAVDRRLLELSAQFKQTDHPPYLNQEEFNSLLLEPKTDFCAFNDMKEALKVWGEMGSILHYGVWSKGLSSLYFLDQNWLASMIATVLRPPRNSVSPPHKQPVSDITHRLMAAGLPFNILDLFLQLLKHFNIGAVHQNSILLPCLLAKSAPGLQVSVSQSGQSLHRFYAMPHVPYHLWSRLILSLLLSVDRFSQSCWQGVTMDRPQLVFWQEGVNMRYSGRSMVVEAATFRSTETNSQTPGILISILTEFPTLADLAVIGFLTDELDLILQNIFSQYNENTELFGIYALCPMCFQVRPCEGVIEGDRLHFSLADCAGSALYGHMAQCHKGYKVDLSDLIPEFLMGDLAQKFHLDSNDLQIQEHLAGGAVGSVHKGVLQGQAVAVKVFYDNPVTPIVQRYDDNPTPTTDSGTSTMSSTTSTSSSSSKSTIPPDEPPMSEYGNFQQMSELLKQREQDRFDSTCMKVCRAFSELRQEIVILSQLQHPCLISLLGVSIRPSLLVVLEFAPFGSLHSVLKDIVKNRPFNKYNYQDRDKTFTPVLAKDLTFKMIYQVAVGLEYLHGHNIIYRDLKCDNILVCSMDPADPINVKISDYGISKFTTSQGMMGVVGTPGFMAPEIMDGQAYNERVDIFSFSMVIYELLTGHPPFKKYGRLHQVYQVVNVEKRRPLLSEYNIVPNFPYLESLMEATWAHDPSKRPSSVDVMNKMEDVSFVLQHSHLDPRRSLPAKPLSSYSSHTTSKQDIELFCNITCVWALKESSRGSSITERNNCWVWESPSQERSNRRLTIYNLAQGTLQPITHKTCPGPPVTCMARVGHYMFVGVKSGDVEIHPIHELMMSDTGQLTSGQGILHSGQFGDFQQGGSIEIYGSHMSKLTRGRNKFDNLEANPVAIIHDKDNPIKGKFAPNGDGFVYVGLSDGTVQIYLHQAKSRAAVFDQWKVHKTLTITASLPLQAMCLTSHRDLVVGCGHSIIIISCLSLLVERRICLLKDVPPSCHSKLGNVSTLVCNDDTLWCAFLNSPLIVEFELSSWTVSAIYCLEADLEVYITEVKIGEQVPGSKSGICEDCRGVSSFTFAASARGRRATDASPTATRHDGKKEEREREKRERTSSEALHPPPRPSKSTKPNSLPRGWKIVETEEAIPEPRGHGQEEEERRGEEVGEDGVERMVRVGEVGTSPTLPPRPSKLLKPKLPNPHPVEEDEEHSKVQLRRRPNSAGNSSPVHLPDITVTVSDEELENLRKSLEDDTALIGSAPRSSQGSLQSSDGETEVRSRTITSTSDPPANREDVFDASAEELPPLPPRRPTSEYTPHISLSNSLSKSKSEQVLTSPNLFQYKEPSPDPPQRERPSAKRRRPSCSPSRRSLPSEHDGVHVQSLLSVKDTLWVGSSCGEILVIGVHKRQPSTHSQENLPSSASKFQKPLSPGSRARMSLNLEAKQMCNLKSVQMEGSTKSGSVYLLLQARNLVVAVRNVTQSEQTGDVAEIALWEACSAERISSVRQLWQSLNILMDDRW